MDIENFLFNALTEELPRDRRVQLVLQLADKLGVADDVTTTAIAEAIAKQRRVIKAGDELETTEGTARAIFVSESDVEVLQRVLGAARDLAA